jgi:hypothetical protein
MLYRGPTLLEHVNVLKHLHAATKTKEAAEVIDDGSTCNANAMPNLKSEHIQSDSSEPNADDGGTDDSDADDSDAEDSDDDNADE